MSRTLVSEEDHLAGIAAATDALTRSASLTWLGAHVPTCPDWRLLDLIAHVGMVHRWATAALNGDRELMGNAAQIEDEGRTHQEPALWLREGSQALVATLESAAPDVDALVFLREAPPPRQFWARRQCHETTIHALDAIAAQTGRAPAAEDAWFSADLAADGIDELLVGFWQRRGRGPRSDTPYAVHVHPTDVPHSWLVRVGPDGTSVTPLEDATGGSASLPAGTTELGGPVIDLYLALWNRGGIVTDAGGTLARWHEGAAITWG